MAVRIAIAKQFDLDFLGHTIHGGKVAIITAEDPDLILNRRYIGVLNGIADELDTSVEEIRQIAKDNLFIASTFSHDVHLFKLQTDGTLKTTKYYDSLLSCLQEIKNLQLVVIDTKTRYSPGEGEGNTTDTNEITHYEAIAKGTGASVMLLHHSNKAARNGSQTGAQAFRGYSAIFDCVRAAWYLRGLSDKELKAEGVKNDETNTYLLLENAKNNYIPICKPILLHRQGYKYSARPISPTMSAESKKEQKAQMLYDKFIGVLQSLRGEWHNQAEIIRVCDNEGIGRKLVKTLIADTLDDEMIMMKNDEKFYKKFALTEEGKLYNVTIDE